MSLWSDKQWSDKQRIGSEPSYQPGAPAQQPQVPSKLDKYANNVAAQTGLTPATSTSAAKPVKNAVKPGGGTALDNMPKFIGGGGIFKYFNVMYTAPKALKEISGKSDQVQPGSKQHVALQKRLQNTAKAINVKYEKLNQTFNERTDKKVILQQTSVKASTDVRGQQTKIFLAERKYLLDVDNMNVARENLEDISKGTWFFQKLDEKGEARKKLSACKAAVSAAKSEVRKEEKALVPLQKAEARAQTELDEWKKSPESKSIAGLQRELEDLASLDDACKEVAGKLGVEVPPIANRPTGAIPGTNAESVHDATPASIPSPSSQIRELEEREEFGGMQGANTPVVQENPLSNLADKSLATSIQDYRSYIEKYPVDQMNNRETLQQTADGLHTLEEDIAKAIEKENRTRERKANLQDPKIQTLPGEQLQYLQNMQRWFGTVRGACENRLNEL